MANLWLILGVAGALAACTSSNGTGATSGGRRVGITSSGAGASGGGSASTTASGASSGSIGSASSASGSSTGSGTTGHPMASTGAGSTTSASSTSAASTSGGAGSGSTGGSVCAPGSQGYLCPLGNGTDGDCCSGVCIDVSITANDCAGCGRVCPAGAQCETTQLQLGSVTGCYDVPDGGSADGGSLAHPCQTGADCPLGADCFSGVCAWMCPPLDAGVGAVLGDGTCLIDGGPQYGLCCAGACVDFSKADNCGSCGNTCDSGVCTTAVYTTSTGYTSRAACLPNATGGACAPSCPHGQACVGGQCLITSCGSAGDTPFCDADGGFGVCCSYTNCSDLLNDPANCGECLNVCDSGVCENAVCQR